MFFSLSMLRRHLEELGHGFKLNEIKEALDIANDIRFAMYPAQGNAAYQAWQKTQEQTLSKVVA